MHKVAAMHACADSRTIGHTRPLLTMELYVGVRNPSARLRWVESWEDTRSSLPSSIAPNMNLGVGYRKWTGGGARVREEVEQECRVLQTVLTKARLLAVDKEGPGGQVNS